MFNEQEMKEYVIKHIDTRNLLTVFRYLRKIMFMGYYQEWNDCVKFPDFINGRYNEVSKDNRSVYINSAYLTITKFSKNNPFKGHLLRAEYTLDELKAELDTRENID